MNFPRLAVLPAVGVAFAGLSLTALRASDAPASSPAPAAPTAPAAKPPKAKPAPQCEVNVNTTLTADGKKLPPPSREHPVYYYPAVKGWTESGAIVAGEKVPPAKMVVHEFAQALAAQGYLVTGPKTPPPTQLLVFFWGCMNPQIEDFGSDDPSQKIFFNQREMVGLVGGSTLPNLDLEMEREAVMQGAEEDRYFAVVMAYDFAAAMQKKKTVLWIARMSTPSNRVSMTEVVSALIKSGGPLFGRETAQPAWVSAPLNEGQVEIGTPVVVPDAAKK